jgi:hypothetical protein
MRKLSFIVVVILAQTSALYSSNNLNLSAQEYYIGIKGGLNVPNLYGGTTELTMGYKSRLTPTLGIISSVEFKNQLAVQLEISYVGQGGLKNGTQVITDGMVNYPAVPTTGMYADFKNRTVLHYLEVPILAKYTITIDKIYNLYFNAGPDFGFLIAAKTKTSGSSQIYIDNQGTPLTDPQGDPMPSATFDGNLNIKKDLNTLNLGLTGGLGISNEFESGELILELRGSYGFSNIWKDSTYGNNHTGSLTITIGYRMNYKPFKKLR